MAGGVGGRAWKAGAFIDGRSLYAGLIETDAAPVDCDRSGVIVAAAGAAFAAGVVGRCCCRGDGAVHDAGGSAGAGVAAGLVTGGGGRKLARWARAARSGANSRSAVGGSG